MEGVIKVFRNLVITELMVRPSHSSTGPIKQEHLETLFIWVRRMNKTRNLMAGIVDSRLCIKDMALGGFPYVCIGKPYMHFCKDLHLYWDISQCLYREAFISANALNRWAWPHTYGTCKHDDLYPISSKCIANYILPISGQFFSV